MPRYDLPRYCGATQQTLRALPGRRDNADSREQSPVLKRRRARAWGRMEGDCVSDNKGASHMITISAFRWVPPFAQGQVRDLRVRWALEEAGLPYKTRLLEQGDQDKPDYRSLPPFGQVPIF